MIQWQLLHRKGWIFLYFVISKHIQWSVGSTTGQPELSFHKTQQQFERFPWKSRRMSALFVHTFPIPKTLKQMYEFQAKHSWLWQNWDYQIFSFSELTNRCENDKHMCVCFMIICSCRGCRNIVAFCCLFMSHYLYTESLSQSILSPLHLYCSTGNTPQHTVIQVNTGLWLYKWPWIYFFIYFLFFSEMVKQKRWVRGGGLTAIQK